MWSPFFMNFLIFSSNIRELAVSNFLMNLFTESPWLWGNYTWLLIGRPGFKSRHGRNFCQFFFNLKCIRVQIPVPIDIFHKEFISIWYVIVLISSKLAMLKVTTGYKLGLSYLAFIYFYWIAEPVELWCYRVVFWECWKPS